MIINQFGDIIKRYREKLGIGSRELSRRIGMTDTYVAQLERGSIKKPNYYVTKKLIDCLNVPQDVAESLIATNGTKPPDTFKTQQDDVNEVYSTDILPWLDDGIEESKMKFEKICSALCKFIESDYTRAQPVISNLDLLITSNKEDFMFFCDVISTGLSKLNVEQRNEVINYINSTLKEDQIPKTS
ncbi:helix-turn-helix domain-containing protein [Ureibacillus acetophenoni]|nr:helix-turn-helix transcriptional regulator [Ureibacillus acetophenoni]